MPSARWQDSHLFWKIGATSLVNVTAFAGSAASAAPANNTIALEPTAVLAQLPNVRPIIRSFRDLLRPVGVWRICKPLDSARIGAFPQSAKGRFTKNDGRSQKGLRAEAKGSVHPSASAP